MRGGFVLNAAPWAAVAAACGALAGCSDAVFEFDSGGVTEPVVITRDPQSTTVTAGENARFAASAAGGSGGVTFQWRRNGQDIAGARRSDYATPTTSADDGTLFTVRVCDESACIDSLPALLTVLRGR
jgi:hypothetical protein